MNIVIFLLIYSYLVIGSVLFSLTVNMWFECVRPEFRIQAHRYFILCVFLWPLWYWLFRKKN